MERKSSSNKKSTIEPSRQPLPVLNWRGWRWVLFFALSWLWASWWMGDLYRMAYENSFLVADPTLMHFLWQTM